MTNFLAIFTHCNYRELLWELTKKEIKQRYKQSVLSYAWVIVNPTVQMLVMSFVFSFIFKFGDNIGVPYPIFLFSGLLAWNLFASSINSSTNALIDNASLLKKIYFPREIFVLSTIIAKVVDFFLASTVFIAMLIIFQINISFHILWFPIIFIIQLLFTYGLGLILSTINLFYRDIQYLVSLIMLVWMYLTPIMYPVETFPEQYRWIFQINPMAVFINAYREIILAHGNPNLISLGIGLILSLIICFIGFKIFKKSEGNFADAV